VQLLERINPFESPPLDTPAPATRGVVASLELRLRGVLSAGGQSIVNVDGTVLSIGETIRGHRLMSVQDSTAVFEKDGRQVVLVLHVEEDAK
jgi:hypothetical protein